MIGSQRASAQQMTTGGVLQQIVVGAGIWIVAVCTVAVPLAGVGLWRPWLVALIASALAAGAWWLARVLPAPEIPRRAGVAMAAVAVGMLVWLSLTASDQVLPRRDSGSNFQAALSMATTGDRIVEVPAAALGGPETLTREGITLASPAFYQEGSPAEPQVQPQFVIGPAAIYSLGYWVGGDTGAQLLAPLATALALLGLGVLTARFGAPRWGVAAMAIAGVSFPIAHVGRSTYSEPLALLTMVAGMIALTVAARQVAPVVERRAATIAGLLVGGTILIRADSLRETMLLTIVGALAILQRRRFGGPLLVAAWAMTAYGLLAALWLSQRYLGDIAGSLIPLAAIVIGVAALAALGVWAGRRGIRMPSAIAARLPLGAGVGVLAVGAFLTSRPFWLVVRQDPNDPGARVVAGLQQREGLAIDGGRTYAEQTIAWMSWWVGPVALVVALLATAWLIRRMAQAWTAAEDLPPWSGPLLIAAGTSVLTLWRPSITPDHPWADRRLVLMLAAVAVLLACTCAWLFREGSRRWSPMVGGLPAAFVVVGTAVPLLVATWPHATERIEAGESGSVAAVCRALQPGDVTLMVDSRAANEWPQVIRGTCGRPALSTTSGLRADPAELASTVMAVATDVERGGGRLVLVAADDDSALKALRAKGIQAVGVREIREDQRLLERPPRGTEPLTVGVWLGTH